MKFKVMFLSLLLFSQASLLAQPVRLTAFTPRQRLHLFRALLFGFQNLPEDLTVTRGVASHSNKVELNVANGEGHFNILEPTPGAPFSVLTARDLSRRQDIATALADSLIFDDNKKPDLPGLKKFLSVIETAERTKMSATRLKAVAGYPLQQSFLNLYEWTGERSALQMLAWLMGRNKQVRGYQFNENGGQAKADLLKPTFYLPNEDLAADYLLVMTYFALGEPYRIDEDSPSDTSVSMVATHIHSARLLTLRLRGSVALQENPDLRTLAKPLRQALDQFNQLATTIPLKSLYKSSPDRAHLIEAAKQVRATIAGSAYYQNHFLWPRHACDAQLLTTRGGVEPH